MKRAAAVLALAMGAVGCGRAGRGAAIGGEPVSLEYANWADYLEADLESRALAPYAHAHPGVRVQQQSAGNGQAEYRERILNSIVAGTPPDVFLLDDIDVPAFANRGVLLDLAPFLPRLGVDLARYDSTVLGIFRRGAAVYAIPKGYTPMVIVYNRDLFDRAGLSYPVADWTWDDFLHTAKALTRDLDGDGHPDQWGTAFDRRPFLWLPWIWSGGGDVLCPDGRRATGCLDSPQTIAAIRWYTDWVTRDSIVPRVFNLRRSMGDNLRLFYTGKVAMLVTGHFWIPNFRPYVDQGRLHIGFVEIPHQLGFAPQTVVYASGLAVPAGAAHRRLSVELAAYLADSVAQRIRAAAGLELPSLTAAGDALAAADTLGWESVFLRAERHARVPWGARIEQWREVEAALPDLMDRITLAGVSPDVAAHEMAERLDRLLAEPTSR
ncbi:MAG TPA: sugar ABC transporter substrate-binding protein [Gemmatimonadales bacterium]|nr:sugar ABC transporter substrate-binding protein [Gemmatimonadales bacterium]